MRKRGEKWRREIDRREIYSCVCESMCVCVCVAQCWHLWLLVMNMFPWLQKSFGGGDPEAEQDKMTSDPSVKL